MIQNIINNLMENIEYFKYIVFYLFIFLFFISIYKFKKDWFEKIYKYRYLAGIIIIVLCVIFEISGSSIGVWKNYFNGDVSEGVILGKSRPIRSDEWVVYTPMAFSQAFNNYGYFTNIIRGTLTDTFIIYGQPVWNICTLYRPFLIGYLLFGSSKGLAFFWSARLIFLFLISFDFCMLITDKKRRLALIGSLLITFAPIVSWWFAINGLVEMLIFGQLAIILLDKYMLTDNYKKRLMYLFGMLICAGGYVLTFYPSWQIPLAFVFLGLAIWRIIDNWKKCKIEKKDIFSILVVIFLFCISIVYILTKSFDTIKAVMNTAYPGDRCETGGEQLKKVFNYGMNLFMSIKEKNIPSNTNTCELAVFFDLFPMGLILTIVALFKNNKKDNLLIILTILFGFLGTYCFIGFPRIISKLTMLSNSQSERTILALGLVNVYMLLRSISLIKESIFNKKKSFIFAFIFAFEVVLINYKLYTIYLGIILLSIMFVILFLMIYSIIRYENKICKNLLLSMVVLVMIISGGLVNPIRRGTNIIYEQKVYKEINEIAQNNDGTWIFDGSNIFAQLGIMAGASTINSTNVYPNLDLWRKIDTERKYDEVYNRYAHIIINLTNDQTNFVLNNPDVFTVYLNIKDIEKLNVKYIYSEKDLEQYSNEHFIIKEINNNIFEVIYSE